MTQIIRFKKPRSYAKEEESALQVFAHYRWQLSLTILLRLGLLEGEIGRLEINLWGPGMVGLGQLDTEIEGSPSSFHRPGDEVVLIRPVVLRFPAEEPGNYSAEIYTNGQHSGLRDSIHFVVREGLRAE